MQTSKHCGEPHLHATFCVQSKAITVGPLNISLNYMFHFFPRSRCKTYVVYLYLKGNQELDIECMEDPQQSPLICIPTFQHVHET